MNGLRTYETQGTTGRELSAHDADLSFQGSRSSVGNLSWSVRATLPIHAPQWPIAGSFQPPLDGAQSHSETPRHATL